MNDHSNEQLILALDQGTTSSRSMLFNHSGEVVAMSQREFPQIFPQSGWVEHDPNEIWASQFSAAAEVVAKAGVTGARRIAAIGITNQRETTIVWERSTGNPIYNAIVWQDRRTADYCRSLEEKGFGPSIKEATGLRLDPYFSATKIHWILENVPDARAKALRGELCFGTVDTWLIWKLTQGRTYVTDITNASRTLLFNIRTLEWEDSLLELFDIPRSMLPEVRESSEIYAETSSEMFSGRVPISGIAGDQQAALFGQMCVREGMVKNTYGTGCFLLMNTGDKPVFSEHNLLTTIAWKIGGKTTYALEGSVFVGGSAIQWLRDGLHLIPNAPSINALAAKVPDNGGIYFVPALTGLGAPYWDSYARGMFIGITRGTTDAHIARATLESIAYQVYDVVKAMEADSGVPGVELRVDGGASASDLLLQFQSDLFRFPIIRPKMLETTAMGAAYLAGLAAGFWSGLDDLHCQWSIDRTFRPTLSPEITEQYLHYWHRALQRASQWA